MNVVCGVVLGHFVMNGRQYIGTIYTNDQIPKPAMTSGKWALGTTLKKIAESLEPSGLFLGTFLVLFLCFSQAFLLRVRLVFVVVGTNASYLSKYYNGMRLRRYICSTLITVEHVGNMEETKSSQKFQKPARLFTVL